MVVLTDLADFPPRFWIEPGIDRVVVGTDEAREQAVAIGIPAERVSRVSGMVLHPRFYRAGGPEARAIACRAELALGEGDFAVTLLFGGKGSPEMAPLAERLLRGRPGLPGDRRLRREPRPLRAARPARGPGGRATRAASASRTGWRRSWPRATSS